MIKNFAKLELNESAILKCLATILITISHLDYFIPYPLIASGGAIGNSLFFFLSGYGLVKSHQKNPEINYFMYLKKRMSRIYPATWIVAFFGIIFGMEKIIGFSSIFSIFIWPTPFWFISAIVIFYIPFFWIVKLDSKSVLYLIFLSTIPYIICYQYLDLNIFSVESPGYFKWIVDFQLMLFGAFIALNKKVHVVLMQSILILIISTILLVLLKLFIFKLKLGYLQFLFQVLDFPIVWAFYHISNKGSVQNGIIKFKLKVIIFLLGGLTLEIYLFQTYWIHWLEGVNFKYSFPIPLLVAILPIVPLSLFIKYIDERVRLSLTKA